MERFLLDTNVISELVRPRPSGKLLSWLSEQPNEVLYISVITLAEIMRGVFKLENGSKKIKLHVWVRKEIPKKFSGRILDFDQEAAFLWGEWQGEGDKIGKPYAMMDAQIAAIAARFELVFITRNIKDFSHLPIQLLSPW